MYNYFMLIGTVTSDVQAKIVNETKKVVNLELAVAREFKNSKGEIIIDKIRIDLWEAGAELAERVLKKGSKVGIKGRIAPKWIKLESGAYASSNDLVGERLIQITPDGELKEYESFDEVNLDNKEEE